MTQPDSSIADRESGDRIALARDRLQAGRLQEALALAREQLQEDPEDAEALYLKAVALRYLGQTVQALKALARLKACQPGYARAYQEEGHNLKQLGELKQAAVAYQRAVDLNHALIASWRELAALHQRLGHQREFDLTHAEYSRLSALPPELVSVSPAPGRVTTPCTLV